MGRTYPIPSFETRGCIGIVRTITIFEHPMHLKICVMRCFGIVRTIPTSSSSCSLSRCFTSTWTILLFFMAWTTLSLCYFTLHCGLAGTVVERLQRYNCIWLTYIVNVEQNILFDIDV